MEFVLEGLTVPLSWISNLVNESPNDPIFILNEVPLFFWVFFPLWFIISHMWPKNDKILHGVKCYFVFQSMHGTACFFQKLTFVILSTSLKMSGLYMCFLLVLFLWMDGLICFVFSFFFSWAFVLNCFVLFVFFSISICVFNFLTNQHCELAEFDVETLLSHVLHLVYVFPLSQVISIRLKRKKVNFDLPCSERLWDSDCDLLWLIIILSSSEVFCLHWLEHAICFLKYF